MLLYSVDNLGVSPDVILYSTQRTSTVFVKIELIIDVKHLFGFCVLYSMTSGLTPISFLFGFVYGRTYYNDGVYVEDMHVFLCIDSNVTLSSTYTPSL
jgi:hypothetical protein